MAEVLIVKADKIFCRKCRLPLGVSNHDEFIFCDLKTITQPFRIKCSYGHERSWQPALAPGQAAG